MVFSSNWLIKSPVHGKRSLLKATSAITRQKNQNTKRDKQKKVPCVPAHPRELVSLIALLQRRISAQRARKPVTAKRGVAREALGYLLLLPITTTTMAVVTSKISCPHTSSVTTLTTPRNQLECHHGLWVYMCMTLCVRWHVTPRLRPNICRHSARRCGPALRFWSSASCSWLSGKFHAK